MKSIFAFTAISFLLTAHSLGQVPDTQQLVEMADTPAGQARIFNQLRRVSAASWQWPYAGKLHARMADHYLQIVENKKSSNLDRLTALRGLRDASIHSSEMTEPQKLRLDAIKPTLMEESNPSDVRLSAFLFYDERHVYEQFVSKAAQREFLVAGLRSSKYEHLRHICVVRVLWGSHLVEDISAYQSAADALVKIAGDPKDWLSPKAIDELMDVPSLAKDLVPALVKQFDSYDNKRDVIKFLGESGSHPKSSLPLLWKLHATQSQRDQKEATLIAIAKVIVANDLDHKQVIQAFGPLMQIDDWHPRYATDDLCEVLGANASSLVTPLIQWLQQKQNKDEYDVAAIARCLANIGPTARQGALQLKDEVDAFEGRQLTGFLQNLARAGLGKDLVPVAMKFIDKPEIRNGVVESLAIAGPTADACVPKLIKLLDDKSTQGSAIKALCRMGKRGGEAGSKLKSMARRDNERAATALLFLYPEDRETVLMAHKVKRYLSPDESKELQAALSEPQFEKLKRTIALSLNGELGKAVARPDVKITVTKAEFGMGKRQIDVTDTIQQLIDEKKSVNRTPKGMGVKDPAPGKKKRLIIKYSIEGKDYSKTFEPGQGRSGVNFSKALIPKNFVPTEVTASGGPATVKKINDSIWRLEPHMSIGVPELGFEWTLTSKDPVGFECHKDGSDTWLRMTPMPTMNDFSFAREKVIEDYRMQVALTLEAAGATFEHGRQDHAKYRAESIRGLTAVMFDYTMKDVEYTHFIGRVFRSAGSFQFEVSAKQELMHQLIGIIGFADFDIDNNSRTPVPDEVCERISAELKVLENVFEMKTQAEVERMITHVFGAKYLQQMKGSGQLKQSTDYILTEVGPQTLASIKAADWQLSELTNKGNAVFFRVPPHGLMFVKTNGEWKLRMR